MATYKAKNPVQQMEESKILDNMSQLPKGIEKPLKSMQQVKKDADLGGMKITHIVKNKQGNKVVAAVVSNGKKNFIYVNNNGVAPLKEEAQMKSFDQIRAEINEAVSPAQQAAIAIAKKEKGEKPKEEGKKMDPAAMAKAMAAFKKKGGKIKKVAPGKAAGYHGKDDPGDGVQGMMDRGDTKGMPRKKKIGSMR